MKRIIAVGSLDAFLHLLVGCFGTLSRYTRNGDEVYLVITLDTALDDKIEQKKLRLEPIQRAAKHIGISMVLFIEGFNYQEISQHNVNLLRSFIEPINPSVVFLPFRNSISAKQSVLGSSTFLACRWIPNILMYEIDRNSSFSPSIFLNLSEYEELMKQECIQEFSSDHDNNSHLHLIKSEEVGQMLYNKIRSGAGHETFEIHRLVLLSTNGVL
jgi:hypothetical protein